MELSVNRKWSCRATLGAKRIADIRRSDVHTWVADLSLSASSIAHCITVLCGVLDDAVADRRIVENRAHGVKLPRKAHRDKSYLTAAQVATLAAESSRPEILCGCWRRRGFAGANWQHCESVTWTPSVVVFVSHGRRRR